jgi:hypothetical protein
MCIYAYIAMHVCVLWVTRIVNLVSRHGANALALVGCRRGAVRPKNFRQALYTAVPLAESTSLCNITGTALLRKKGTRGQLASSSSPYILTIHMSFPLISTTQSGYGTGGPGRPTVRCYS